jgi:hypothetical protein
LPNQRQKVNPVWLESMVRRDSPAKKEAQEKQGNKGQWAKRV